MKLNHKQSVLKNIQKRLNNATTQITESEKYIDIITKAKKSKLAEVSIRQDSWCSFVITSSQYDEILIQHKELKKQAKLRFNRYTKDIEKLNTGGKLSKKTKEILTAHYNKQLDSKNNIINQFTDELQAFKKKVDNNETDGKWLSYKGQSIAPHFYPTWKEEREGIVTKYKEESTILTERLETLKKM